MPITNFPADDELRRIAVKTRGRTLLFRVDQIDWIESAGNYVRLHIGPERHLLRATMAGIEGKLQPRRFVRIHRSAIVNLERVRELRPTSHGDFTVNTGDLTQLPPSVVTDMAQALGKTLGGPLAPGQPLRADALRILPAIVQGQTVRLISQGQGFRVSAEGKALANAGVGQLAQIRTSSGQTVSGVARADGTVHVTF